MVFREKLLRKYSFKTIYGEFLKDLKKLEQGIVINSPITRRVKCGVLLYASDNLEASVVGGFSACFSSKDICRHCHIQYKDLETKIHGHQHNFWTKEEYDKIIRKVSANDTEEADEIEVNVNAENLLTEHSSDEESPDDDDDNESGSEHDDDDENEQNQINTRGIKSECPLNSLSSFHCITSFPPDIMHDLFEGVIPEDLLCIIRILVSKGWFTLQQYNTTLHNLEYAAYETGDKPYPVPTSSKVKKLKGKAVSNWTHLRNWPVVIRKFVLDFEDEVLILGLKLHDIVERLTAQSFLPYEVDLLEEKITKYLNMRANIRSENPDVMSNPKPKHHFLRRGYINNIISINNIL